MPLKNNIIVTNKYLKSIFSYEGCEKVVLHQNKIFKAIICVEGIADFAMGMEHFCQNSGIRRTKSSNSTYHFQNHFEYLEYLL